MIRAMTTFPVPFRKIETDQLMGKSWTLRLTRLEDYILSQKMGLERATVLQFYTKESLPICKGRRGLSVRDVISPAAGSSDRDRISGSARSESRPDRGRLPFVAVAPPSRSAI
jgi:hypothetical protein